MNVAVGERKSSSQDGQAAEAVGVGWRGGVVGEAEAVVEQRTAEATALQLLVCPSSINT